MNGKKKEKEKKLEAGESLSSDSELRVNTSQTCARFPRSREQSVKYVRWSDRYWRMPKQKPQASLDLARQPPFFQATTSGIARARMSLKRLTNEVSELDLYRFSLTSDEVSMDSYSSPSVSHSY
ncbi:hypothetical protein PoB_005012300 [Plakobranchus ocellatus]|uniref:Uncharacterized protein n=1 Tax=Plakobranchus ocellatus TaxID=259542 RepID=A0AAV4BVJ4_9GAST|nr:hypothetical protein PoB_005012300 [Plakobranchus ocellatus]